MRFEAGGKFENGAYLVIGVFATLLLSGILVPSTVTLTSISPASFDAVSYSKDPTQTGTFILVNGGTTAATVISTDFFVYMKIPSGNTVPTYSGLYCQGAGCTPNIAMTVGTITGPIAIMGGDYTFAAFVPTGAITFGNYYVVKFTIVDATGVQSTWQSTLNMISPTTVVQYKTTMTVNTNTYTVFCSPAAPGCTVSQTSYTIRPTDSIYFTTTIISGSGYVSWINYMCSATSGGTCPFQAVSSSVANPTSFTSPTYNNWPAGTYTITGNVHIIVSGVPSDLPSLSILGLVPTLTGFTLSFWQSMGLVALVADLGVAIGRKIKK